MENEVFVQNGLNLYVIVGLSPEGRIQRTIGPFYDSDQGRRLLGGLGNMRPTAEGVWITEEGDKYHIELLNPLSTYKTKRKPGE